MDSLFKQASADSAPFDKIEENILDAALDIEGDELMLNELDQGGQDEDALLVDELGLQTKDSVQAPGTLAAQNDAEAGGDVDENQIEDAKAPEEDLEVSRVGTPFYLAPELWKTPKYSPASDIWALGVILYEICCLSYPFPATEMDELEQKVLNEKIAKHPNFVSQDFVNLFQKMLNKSAAKRPCIETIIFSDIFQTKAQQNHITLPLILNKQKLQDKFSLGQLAGVELTEKQKRLAGILYPAKPTKLKADPKPSARQSILNQNLNNKKDTAAKNDKEDSPLKKPTTLAPREVKRLEKPTLVGRKEPANQPQSTKNQGERGDVKNVKDRSAPIDNVKPERASIGSKRGVPGLQPKQPSEGATDKEADKDIQQRRAAGGTNRFAASRQSVASNMAAKTKGDDSPQKRDQNKLAAAKKYGQNQKAQGQAGSSQPRHAEGINTSQRAR